MRIQVSLPKEGSIAYHVLISDQDHGVEAALDQIACLENEPGADGAYAEANAKFARAYQRAAERAAIAMKREAGDSKARSCLQSQHARRHQVYRGRARVRCSRRRVVRGPGDDDGGAGHGGGDPESDQPRWPRRRGSQQVLWLGGLALQVEGGRHA